MCFAGTKTLGLAAGNTIWLDVNAAGWGWFVDPTPWDDSEFLSPGDQGEQHRMDLPTVIAHELGHVLGNEHDDHGVMQHTLAAGQRNLILEDRVDHGAGCSADSNNDGNGLRSWSVSRRHGLHYLDALFAGMAFEAQALLAASDKTGGSSPGKRAARPR